MRLVYTFAARITSGAAVVLLFAALVAGLAQEALGDACDPTNCDPNGTNCAGCGWCSDKGVCGVGNTCIKSCTTPDGKCKDCECQDPDGGMNCGCYSAT